MPHSSPENAPTPRRVLNVKALAFFATICIVLNVGFAALHKKQVVKTRDYLKQTAEEALAADEHNRAFDLYEQYLVLSPDDLKVQEIIATLLQEHGTEARELQRAFDINERLLLQDRERDDLRVKQVQLAEKLGRYSEASGHLEVLRSKDSTIPAVWHYSGVIAEDTGAYSEAIEFYQKAAEFPDAQPDTFERLSHLLTKEAGNTEQAERLLNDYVNEAGGDSKTEAKAHAIRAHWYLNQDRPHYAIADLWMSLEGEPSDVRNNATLLKAVRLATARDHEFDSTAAYQKLIQHYRQLLGQDPNQSQIRLFLSSALWETKQQQDAIANLQEGIERDSREYELYEVLVDYLVSDRQLDLAQAYFDRIPKRALDRGRREFMRGRLLMCREEWEPAVDAFELAVGLSHKDKDMGSRARICLALCRRESGNTKAAMDTYKDLVKDDPNSEGGQLGIASAYLRSNQLDLAIAEYRQLMHVDGVPPFLANLMIRHNLTLPRTARRWDELKELLDERAELIADPVQRTLLTVDMIFAQGFPARAMDFLDDAARRWPDQPEFKRAFDRLNAVHGDGLQKRIQQALDDDATNLEAHESMLKLLAARDNGEMRHWLEEMMRGSAFPTLRDEDRFRMIANTASVVADGELATRGDTAQVRVLLQYANTAWKTLSERSQEYLPGRIRFVAAYQSGAAAAQLLKATNVSSSLRKAECWLEIARYERSLLNTVAAEIIALIRAEPKNFYLRIAFVDLQLLSGKHESAASTLKDLQKFDPTSGLTVARQAWMALLVSRNVKLAEQLSKRAVALSGTDTEVRAIRGLALAENGALEEASELLDNIPLNLQSPSLELYQTRAQQLNGDIASARYSLRKLLTRRVAMGLAPAERDLLKRIQTELEPSAARPPRSL